MISPIDNYPAFMSHPVCRVVVLLDPERDTYAL
jgi:hypothetical protein